MCVHCLVAMGGSGDRLGECGGWTTISPRAQNRLEPALNKSKKEKYLTSDSKLHEYTECHHTHDITNQTDWLNQMIFPIYLHHGAVSRRGGEAEVNKLEVEIY